MDDKIKLQLIFLFVLFIIFYSLTIKRLKNLKNGKPLIVFISLIFGIQIFSLIFLGILNLHQNDFPTHIFFILKTFTLFLLFLSIILFIITFYYYLLHKHKLNDNFLQIYLILFLIYSFFTTFFLANFIFTTLNQQPIIQQSTIYVNPSHIGRRNSSQQSQTQLRQLLGLNG